jgi:2-dehydro-3-deoxyphosphooctonate aldolase (KDO 8-P synthase)
MLPLDFEKEILDEKAPLLVICGPCVIEGEDHALRTAEDLKEIFTRHNCNWVYKSSYDKANRTSIDSYRGPGIDEGLRILEKVKNTFNLPLMTDVHNPSDAKASADVCDILQIPAFLSRQTDLVVACGETQAIVNIKKGQFMAPWDMEHSVKKVESTKNKKIFLTDRGSCFGYNNLVTDIRSIPIMKNLGYPVCFDATHSTQLPGGNGRSSGGQREFALPLAKAAIAAGAKIIYIEAHPNPSQAKSDAATVLAFDELEEFLRQANIVYEACQGLTPCPSNK